MSCTRPVTEVPFAVPGFVYRWANTDYGCKCGDCGGPAALGTVGASPARPARAGVPASAVAGKVYRVAASGAVHRTAEGRGSYGTYSRGPATP